MKMKIYRDWSCNEHCVIDIDCLVFERFPQEGEVCQFPGISGDILWNRWDLVQTFQNAIVNTGVTSKDTKQMVILSALQKEVVYQPNDLIANRIIVLSRMEIPIHNSFVSYYDLLDGDQLIIEYPYHPWCTLHDPLLADGTHKWRRM